MSTTKHTDVPSECPTCFAIVSDIEKHLAWHQAEGERLGKVAQLAYRSAAMTQPLR